MIIQGTNYTNQNYKELHSKSEQINGNTNKIEQYNNLKNVSFGSLDADTFLGNIFSDIFSNIFSEITKTSNSIIHDLREKFIEDYINTITHYKNNINIKNRNSSATPIETWNNYTFRTSNDNLSFLNQLLTSSGIDTLGKLINFIRLYTGNQNTNLRKIFKRQDIEAIKIFGVLKSQSDLGKFPELLLYLYNREEGKEEPDYNLLNDYTEFLKQIGLNDFNNFNSKFAHLKSDFNDFDNIADKVAAIDYIRDTYDERIAYLEGIKSQLPEYERLSAQDIYAKTNNVVDFLYGNEGYNSEQSAAIIKIAMTADKIKPSALKNTAKDFNGFQTIEDTVIFYELLSECKVSANDVNVLFAKSIVSDNDTLSNIINKRQLTDYISEYKQISPSESEVFYKKYADIINAVFDDNSGDMEDVGFLINVIETFGINGNDSFLSFYNRAASTKKKNLTIDEIRTFLDLLRFTPSKDLFKQAKGQNITAVELLQKEKSNFDQIKDDIEQFIESDESAYFAGKTALEIYTSYKDILSDSSQSVINILRNIADFNIGSSDDYKQKTADIKKFSKFFPDKKHMLEFISTSAIKFDAAAEDKEYRQNCLCIFDSLYDEEDIETSQNRIASIVSSGFLRNSKTKLTEFLSQMPEKSTRKAVLSVIADKKVGSINALEKFFKTYKQNNTTGKELLKYLHNLPDNIDFRMTFNILTSLQERINSLNIPISINSSNINMINTEEYISPQSVSSQDIAILLNAMCGIEGDSNFISALPETYERKNHKYSAFNIAHDIVVKKDKSDESYQNIVRIFGLEKDNLKLPQDCSDYIYIEAIAKTLPKEFIEFVNSDEWLDYKYDGETIPNLALHARLRAIDRFALNDASDIKVLYSEETKRKLQELFKTIYTSIPSDIKGTDQSKRIIINTGSNSNVIKAVFTNKGQIITIIPITQQRV